MTDEPSFWFVLAAMAVRCCSDDPKGWIIILGDILLLVAAVVFFVYGVVLWL